LNEIHELNRMGGKKNDAKAPEAKKKESIEKILSHPQNLTNTLKEAFEAAAKAEFDGEENLSVVEKQSNASGLQMFAQTSPEGQKSLVSANQNKSMQEDNMDLMLQDFNNQSRSQADGDPSFVNKEGETESAAEELDHNQIDLENLNESELMALQ